MGLSQLKAVRKGLEKTINIRAAPEKSGLHACGQADRVIALESWEGLGPQDVPGMGEPGGL